MRRFLPTLAAVLTLSAAAHAQVSGAASAVGASAMGTTSPLGVLGATSSPLTSGIPLNATQINPGGLSPMPIDPCATPSPTTPSGTFDGGGLAGCTTTAVQPPLNGQSLSGTASPLTSPGSDPAQSGATVPLNAIEIDNAGISPLIVAPTAQPTTTATMTTPTLPSSAMTSPTMTSPTSSVGQ